MAFGLDFKTESYRGRHLESCSLKVDLLFSFSELLFYLIIVSQSCIFANVPSHLGLNYTI